MRCTFRRCERLRRKVDFERLELTGRRFAVQGVVVLFKKGERRRLGVSVGRRVGKAVDRNRLKRLAREYFRLNKQLLPVGDVLLVFRRGMAELTNQEVFERIEKALALVRKEGK